MRSLILVTLTIMLLVSCVKSFTNNKDVLDVDKNNTRVYQSYDAITGDSLFVADSAPKLINGVWGKAATSVPRRVTHVANDSLMKVNPPYEVVRGWLKAENYYSFWLPLAIFFGILGGVAFFIKRVGKGGALAWSLFVVAGACLYGSYEAAGRKARVISEQNQKTMPIEQYRDEVKKDSMKSYWQMKYDKNELIKR